MAALGYQVIHTYPTPYPTPSQIKALPMPPIMPQHKAKRTVTPSFPLFSAIPKGGLQLCKSHCKPTSNPNERVWIINTPITHLEGFRMSLVMPVQMSVIKITQKMLACPISKTHLDSSITHLVIPCSIIFVKLSVIQK